MPSGKQITLEYNRVLTCHNSDFPVSVIKDMEIDPESAPLLMMHSHDAVEIGYCHSGPGILFVDNRVVSFAAGDVCVIGDQVTHISRSARGEISQWSFFWIDAAMLMAAMPDAMEMLGDNPFSKAKFPYIFSPKQHPELCAHVLAIITEMRQQSFGYRSLVKAHAAALMALVYRVSRHLQQHKPAGDSEGIARISPALHHMITHYAQPMGVEELASLTNLSRRHFYRIFLTVVGLTPLHYLAQLRVRMAAAILSQSDKPVSQVAFDVGFESLNTFNRQFLATLSVSPSQWRRQCRRPHPPE